MPDARLLRIDRWIGETIQLQEQVRQADPAPLLRAADAIAAGVRSGRPLLAFGNGGSAADAQHFVAELAGRFQGERPALAAVALTTNPSLLTAVANDYGYDRVFARQIEGLGGRGGVAVAISTSGRSPNVLEGLRAATTAGMTTVALTGGDGGEAGRLADVHLNVPGRITAHVQEVHITVLHLLCALVEEALAAPPADGSAATGRGSERRDHA
ncbi:MAG TPA: SIS domain-containing protein [Methylomirabilota bacterium]